jgi:hypothetical protein
MRAQSIYDRSGNSYRFHRAKKQQADKEERIASSKLWDDIYQKAPNMAEKDEEID